MVDVITEIVINRDRAVVSAYAENPENARAWYRNITSSRWVTPPPIRVGSRMEFAAHFLGKKLHYTYEVSNYVPNEKLVMGTADGAMETTYTWQTVGKNTTHMTLRNRGKAPGFTALLDPIMKLAVRFATQKNLKQLKGILEK